MFVNLRPDQTLKGIFFNGRDITADLEDNSILLPADAQGQLEICLESSASGIEDENTYEREFGIRNAIKKLNRQLEKVEPTA